MKIVQGILFCTILVTFFACHRDQEISDGFELEQREQEHTQEEVMFIVMSGLENGPEHAAGDCGYGGACAVPPFDVYGIEEELIIEAIAKDLCLAKFSKLNNGAMRMDLVASPDSHERYLRDRNEPRDKFNLGIDGRFAKATKFLGLGNGGCKQGVYTPRQQSSNRYWSGYIIFESKDLL